MVAVARSGRVGSARSRRRFSLSSRRCERFACPSRDVREAARSTNRLRDYVFPVGRAGTMAVRRSARQGMSPAPAQWAKEGIGRGFARTFREPRDIVLALRIGAFLWTLPRRLDRQPLDLLLHDLARESRHGAGDLHSNAQRISRLRQAWLASPLFRARNTCYVRALTLFRFLADDGRAMRIHFGVEPGTDPGDRVRGHAWVTVGDEVLEAPEPLLSGRVSELYAFPAR